MKDSVKKKKRRRSGNAQIVIQGLLLLAVLAILISMAVRLSYIAIADMANLTPEGMNLPAAETALQEAEQTAAATTETALKETDQTAEELARAETGQQSAEPIIGLTEAEELRYLGAALYAAFALLFLLKALSLQTEWKANLFRYGIGAVCFAACAVLSLGADPVKACRPVAVLHAAALIADHIFAIVRKHKVRYLITRIIFILLTAILLTGLVISGATALFMVQIMTLPRIFYYIAQIAFSSVKLDILRKILRKTYAAEIIFGIVLLIVAFSIILPAFEPGINNFGDALWYCFAIVTTIGFGDFAAAGIIGRIISVILGIYGIIVVALVTSIIVNFYNETKNDPDEEDEEDEEDGENGKDTENGEDSNDAADSRKEG